MEAEPMRVLQFAKRSVVTVAFVGLTLAGCGGESSPDAPFNPAGASADLEAMNATFGSPTFASFSTFSLMFDAALGGAPIISASAAALDIRATGGNAGVRAAAIRSAQRIAAITPKPAKAGSGISMMTLPVEAAGKVFIYDPGTATYVAPNPPELALNTVRFMLYEVDPGTFAPKLPLVEIGHVDLIDLSAGTTQAARVIVVGGNTTYLDYTVSASSTASSGRVNVIGYVTDGTTQANINLRSTLTFTAGLTLTYSLDLPTRDVAIDLTVNMSDYTSPTSPIVINLLMKGPNGTIAMSGQFTDTTGTLSIRISGDAFATITTNGATTTITRNDGTPLSDDELITLNGVFDIQAGAFASFDQMMTPVGMMMGG
jgi:hypothetical protein